MHFSVLIIGGGTAGIAVAAQLRNKHQQAQVAIIEPAEQHWYQPAWTLVGAGTYRMADTVRPMASLIPKGVTWLKDRVESLQPEANALTTAQGQTHTYDHLVVATGLVNDLDGIEGLREALETDSVCSNYLDPEKTWRILKNFKGGNALFTQPSTPIKCGGAPQKIMYLAEHYLRKVGLRDKSKVIFATPGSVIFGVKEFARTLMDIIQRRNIILKTSYSPVLIDWKKKEVHFRYTLAGQNNCSLNADPSIAEFCADEHTLVIPYDMLHLAPPQQAPAFVRRSTLAVAQGPSAGWLEVDKHTLRHPRHANVWGLGDVAALPTAKTGAAVRKQAPVVVAQLLASLRGSQAAPTLLYDGYSSCPLVTGYGSMVLAEFKYDNVRDSDPLLSRLWDTTKEQWSMWLLKKYALPFMYWNLMMKGRL